MGLLDRIRKALVGGAPGQPATYWVYAQCRRCGEPLQARINLNQELSLADDEETYVVHKGLPGTGARRCFQVVDVTLHFDAQKASVIDSEVTGGRLISAEEYQALLEEGANAEADHRGELEDEQDAG
jgi:hypothetical protein